MPIVISPWPTGKGGWRVRIKIKMPDGRRIEVSKKSPLSTMTQTRAWAHELERVLFAQALAPKVAAKVLAPTVARFAPRFLEYLTNRRRAPATVTAYEVGLRMHILPALGRCRLDEVTPVDHERLLAALAELKRSTASEVIKTFNRLLTVAEELKVVEVKLPRCPSISRDPPPVRAYSSIEASKVIAACSKLADRALVLLGFHGGLRRSEIAGLRREDFSPTCDAVTISRHVWRRQVLDGAKHGKVRTVRLSATAAATLREHLAEMPEADAWLFPSRPPACRRFARLPAWVGGPTTGENIATRLERACKRAGVDYCGAHVMRRGAATAAARAGASPAALASFLGHSDLRMAQRYIAHLGDDGARIAASLDSYGAEPGRDTGAADSDHKES